MAFIGKQSQTRGALVKLRSYLAFAQNGLNILELKRDRLAEELNLLLKKMKERDEAERLLLGTYDDFKDCIARIGYAGTRSQAYSSGKIKVRIVDRSIMGVLIPDINIASESLTVKLHDADLYRVFMKMSNLMKKWIEIGETEAGIERIAYDLALVNRKVNAIEKAVIPAYIKKIKYIEDFLSDEELENFVKIKHSKAIRREGNA